MGTKKEEEELNGGAYGCRRNKQGKKKNGGTDPASQWKKGIKEMAGKKFSARKRNPATRNAWALRSNPWRGERTSSFLAHRRKRERKLT